MLHDDIPHILLYILIWLIFRFPTVKYANTKHGGAEGIILWALLTVFLVIVVVVQENSFACVSFKVIVKDQSYWFRTISINVTFISSN